MKQKRAQEGKSIGPGEIVKNSRDGGEGERQGVVSLKWLMIRLWQLSQVKGMMEWYLT